jgi:hypothetical protein
MEDLDVDMLIILLKCILNLFEAWTKSIWIRIDTGGGLPWMLYWKIGFHKMRGISWLAENRLGSRERLSPMALLTAAWTNKTRSPIFIYPWGRCSCNEKLIFPCSLCLVTEYMELGLHSPYRCVCFRIVDICFMMQTKSLVRFQDRTHRICFW